MHITDCIKYCGPCWNHWQFPIERICGMLLPFIKSKENPYTNLANNVLLLEQFFHLPYFNISKTIFRKNIEKEWQSNLVFGNINGYEEELYWPSMEYNLKDIESKHLYKYYHNQNNNQAFTLVSINNKSYILF